MKVLRLSFALLNVPFVKTALHQFYRMSAQIVVEDLRGVRYALSRNYADSQRCQKGTPNPLIWKNFILSCLVIVISRHKADDLLGVRETLRTQYFEIASAAQHFVLSFDLLSKSRAESLGTLSIHRWNSFAEFAYDR